MSKESIPTTDDPVVDGHPIATLTARLYDYVLEATESFEINKVGADLAYLMGAILKDSYCKWPSSRPILELVRKWEDVEARDKVLTYILQDDAESAEAKVVGSKWKCPECGSTDVQVSLPAWHTETEDGSLTYVETDAEASIAYFYCPSCGASEAGEPSRTTKDKP